VVQFQMRLVAGRRKYQPRWLVDVTVRYFEDCQEAGPHQPGIRRGVASYTLDPEHATRLWELSLGMLSASA
jgi:hypothetical protein